MDHTKKTLTAIRLLAWVSALSLAACAGSPSRSERALATKPTESAEADLHGALELVAQKSFPQALAALRAVIEAKSFAGLSSADRYRALAAAGWVALRLQQPGVADKYLARAAQMPDATANLQSEQLRTAMIANDWQGAVVGLTALATRWPERLARVTDEVVLQVLYESRRLPRGSAMPLLQALYQVHWTLRWGLEPSWSWHDLALLLLERGRFSDAIEVCARITAPDVLISIRADRRFDTVVAARPAAFDIEAAESRELEALQPAEGDAGRSLQLKAELMGAMLVQRRYGAALAISDSVIDEIRSTNYPEKKFVDYREHYVDLLAARAEALESLGRWSDAVEQLTAASHLYENHADNVSEVIDLAQLYCDLERPTEGLAALAAVGSNMSAFGRMQSESVRLDAASQLADQAQLARSLRYLREHRSDAPFTYLWALLVVDETPLAADFLIGLLHSEDDRQTMLLRVQTYLPPPGTPRNLEIYGRWRALIARPDVRHAIDRVGRIERYERVDEFPD